MGKRNRKSSENDAPGFIRRLGDGVASIAARLSLRQWVAFAAVVAFVAGVWWALGRMERTVRAMPAANPKPSIKLVNVPEWAEKEGWLPRLSAAVSLGRDDQWSSPDLTERLADRFRRSGWVKDVQWVRKSPDGSILVSCSFRRPVGMVQTKEGFVPVDDECCRLPEVYDRLSPGWIIIVGVQTAPPAPGNQWQAKDLRAGVRLTSLLFDRPFASQIASIDVSNYAGRDPNRHRITLLTQRGMHIRWGSAPGEEVYEPTVAEKIRNIEHVLQSEPTREWIDVSIFGNRVVAPRPAPAEVRVVKTPPDHK